MSDVTRDDLRVDLTGCGDPEWVAMAILHSRPLTPSEWEAILEAEAPKHGWVKGDVCDACGGSGLLDGHGHRPHPNDTDEAHDCSSCPYPCPSCGGSGTKRMAAVDGIDVEALREALAWHPVGLAERHAQSDIEYEVIGAIVDAAVRVLAAIDQEGTP